MRPRPTPHAARRHVTALARVGYVLVILLATLSDLHFDPSAAGVPFRLARAFDLHLHMRDAVDAVRNLALFAGLGVVWVVTSPSGRIVRSMGHVTVVGFLLSVCVETLQLFSPVRNSSVIDVTTNTVGTLAGALCVILCILLVRTARGGKSFVGVPAFLFTGAYGVAVLMEAFAPLFRQALLPNLGGGVAQRIGEAWQAMQLHSITQVPLIDVLLFFPAGAFAVAALVESGVSYAWAWPMTALVGAVLCAATEVVHGVAGEPIQLGAIVSHAGAITLGALGAARWLPAASTRLRGRERPRALLLAYGAIVLLWSWRPFLPELNAESIREQLQPVHWIPLAAMAQRVDLFSVTDIVTQFLLYLPLGALLAVWPLRTRGVWRGVLPALYLSVVMEVGKIFVAERFMDVTHILIQIAGAAIGWIIVRRSGFPVYGALMPERPAPSR